MEQAPNYQSSIEMVRRRRCSERMSIAFLAPARDNTCIRSEPVSSPSHDASSGSSTSIAAEKGSEHTSPATGRSDTPAPLMGLVDGVVRDIREPKSLCTRLLSADGGVSDLAIKKRRATRLLYTEEQKFFLMYVSESMCRGSASTGDSTWRLSGTYADLSTHCF